MNAEPETPEPDDERIDGFTLDELADYLAAGRTPANPTIDESVECQHALAMLGRLDRMSDAMLVEDAEQSPIDEGWMRGLLQHLGREVRAGRDIPLTAPDEASTVTVTEGAVRALIRDAGDVIDGAIIGSTRIVGDVTEPGAIVRVEVGISALSTARLVPLADRLRPAIAEALETHTELAIAGIDIRVSDIHTTEGDR